MLSFFASQDPRRIRAYEQFCFDHNMFFAEKDEFGLGSMLQFFSIFRQNRSGKIYNIAYQKQSDLSEQEYLFDYRYKVVKGKAIISYKQTIYFLNSRMLALPAFGMKPEQFGHKIEAFLGLEDIDFEDYPVFSQKYYLKGEDEAYIRATFGDKILKFFSKHHGWTCEAVNYYLIVYKHNAIPYDHELGSFYTVCRGVGGLFKEASREFLNPSLE